MAFVVGHWPPFVRGKWVTAIACVVAESRETARIIAISPRKSVISIQREVPTHALPETEVDAIVGAAVDGFIISDAIQYRLAGVRKCAGKRPDQGHVTRARVDSTGKVRIIHDLLIDIDGFVLM